MKRVVVTGIGIVSCIGNDQKTVIKNLKELNSGISKAPEYEEYSFRSLVHGKPNIKLEDEIEILPEFRDIFTNKYSLLGSKGKTILELRKKHKMKR